MTIEAGNKLIAEFMGAKIAGINHDYDYKVNCFYHSSWDWQIPAYSKLVKLSNVRAMTKGYAINHNLFIDKYLDAVCDNNTVEGQKIIVEFIKWYNQSK